jgi:hypothetical protein
MFIGGVVCTVDSHSWGCSLHERGVVKVIQDVHMYWYIAFTT